MSMRIFLTFILLITLNSCLASEINLRGYDEYDIPAGIHIPVISLQEFSTAYCEEGDEVKFKTTNDIYLYDKNVIPAGTTLSGYIDKKNEPIIGTHAAMKVFVNKMYFSDGSVVPIKSFIYTANDNLIGGEITEPANYIRKPHYSRWTMFRTFSVTQSVPGKQRKMGEHVTVAAGADLIIVLVAPIHLIHSVMK